MSGRLQRNFLTPIPSKPIMRSKTPRAQTSAQISMDPGSSGTSSGRDYGHLRARPRAPDLQDSLTGHPCDPPAAGTVGEPSTSYGGVGWTCGNPHDYNREYCVDLIQLAAFLRATQPQPPNR